MTAVYVALIVLAAITLAILPMAWLLMLFLGNVGFGVSFVGSIPGAVILVGLIGPQASRIK